MRPADAIIAVDAVVQLHAKHHYLTLRMEREMASAIIAEMEPPANVPGITLEDIVAACEKVRESRQDKRR